MLGLIIIYIITSIILVVVKMKKDLLIFQQNLYNNNNRQIKWVAKNIFSFINIEILNVILPILMFFIEKDSIINKILFIAIIIINLLSILINNNNINIYNERKKFNFTNRVARLIGTYSILFILNSVFLIYNYCYKSNINYNILICSSMIYFNSIAIVLINFINKPLEKMTYTYYLLKAKKKLKQHNDLKVIGITGSYGKTSSKNILNDILSVKYNVLATPQSLNTPYGLMKTINEKLSKFDEVFIAEMGAYKKGEIEELCNIVKQKYSILTNIGTAHLEIFGSEENIQKTKFEIVETLPDKGIAILNKDDKKQLEYNIKNNKELKVIWIGIDNKDADVCAGNIKCTSNGTVFTLYLKGEKESYEFATKLLGRHNVYNILAGIALGIEFGIDLVSLQKSVKNVKQIPHRLELKKISNFYQIDDAYNSNPVGASNALKVLSLMSGIKVVVTPGMVELGVKEEEYNEKFGEEIADVADYVILIGERKTLPIRKGLENKKFDNNKVIVYNDVREAYKYIQSINTNQDVFALFENDLPDTYSE